MTKALIVIDIQNDYFDNGKFPLWNTDNVLENIENTIRKANDNKIPVILIQHIADNKSGALFFTEGSSGAEIHPRILKISSQAPIVRKSFADAFFNTKLEETLSKLKVTELLICGMMTQNCVTHTAISKSAEKYKVSVLTDCCTTVNEIIHKMALSALSTRITLSASTDNIFNPSKELNQMSIEYTIKNIECNIKNIFTNKNDFISFNKQIKEEEIPYLSKNVIKKTIKQNYPVIAMQLIKDYEYIVEKTLDNEYKDDILIAWIDIVGFKNMIQEKEVETLQKYSELIAVVNNWDKIHTEDDKHKIIETRIHIINDAFIIHTKSIGKLITILNSLLLKSFSLGFYTRGAIVKGKLFEFENTVYGKGLLNAYNVEHEQKDNLRVAIHDSAKSIITNKLLENYIEQDSDGQLIYNYYQYIGNNDYFETYEPEFTNKIIYINKKIDTLQIEKLKIQKAIDLNKSDKLSISNKLNYLIGKLELNLKNQTNS